MNRVSQCAIGDNCRPSPILFSVYITLVTRGEVCNVSLYNFSRPISSTLPYVAFSCLL